MEANMDNIDLRRQIINALEFNPSFDATRVSVVANDGIVTLSGWAVSAQERFGLVAAVQNIVGVEAVADELDVGLIPNKHRRDEDLARQVAAVVRHTIDPVPERLHIKVEKGWVTLSGDVDSYFQGRLIEKEISRLSDVEGITNNINQRADPSSEEVASQVRVVFERDLYVMPASLSITCFGGKVTFEGTVHSEEERTLAARAAEAMDGVNYVENRLIVVVPVQ
jgi:osmotically-inducible protein OsmY